MNEFNSDNTLALKPFNPVHFKDLSESEINPFLEHLQLKNRQVLKKFKQGEAVIPENRSVSQDEITSLNNQQKSLKPLGLGIGKLQNKEITEFVLVYKSHKIDFDKFSYVTLVFFLYILYEKTNLGCDYIISTPQEVQEKLKLSKSNSYKVFVELCNEGILCKRTDSVWWINPNYFYAGNRLKILNK